MFHEGQELSKNNVIFRGRRWMKITFYQKGGGRDGFSEGSVLTASTFQYGKLCSWKNIICTPSACPS